MKPLTINLCKALFTGFLFFIATPLFSQTKYLITLNAKGQVQPELLEKLFPEDLLLFKVIGSGESIDLYKQQLKTRLTKALGNITKLQANASKLKMLTDLYGIVSGDLDRVANDIRGVIADPNKAPDALTFLPNFGAGADKYFSVTVTTGTGPTSKNMAANTNSDPFPCTQANGQSELDFTVTKTDPLKKLAFDWVGHTGPDFPNPVNTDKYLSYKNDVKKQLEVISAFTDRVTAFVSAKPQDGSKVGRLRILRDSADLLNRSLNDLMGTIKGDMDLSAYKKWILEWLWFQTGSIPSLNPLPFLKTDDFGDEPDTSDLEGINDRISVRQAIIKDIDLKKVSVRQLDSLIGEMDSLKRVATQLTNASKAYTALTQKNDAATKDFGSTSSQLNKGILFTSNQTTSVYWMRHHDATTGQQLMNGLTATEYLETDRVIILDHNLAGTEKAAIHISFEDITDDRSQLAETVSPLIKAMTGAVGSLTFAARLNSFDLAKDSLSKSLAALTTAVKAVKPYDTYLDYLSSQHNPPLDVKEIVDESGSYHSQVVNPAKRTDGPKKATYYINITNSDPGAPAPPAADTFTYRVNKLYRIFPMAGISWTLPTFNTISYDSAGHQTVTATDKHLHFIVGLKVFLRKTDIRNPKFILGKDDNGKRLFLSRTSIHLAFDAGSPLQNIYTGVGFDLWPGFCISAGAAFNQYKYGQYAQDKLIKSQTLYRTGLYLGLSTDLSLFTDITKFLNLTK